MDLVDIDKVLDNLELNEEEHKDESPIIKQLQILNSPRLYPGDIIPLNASNSMNETEQDTVNYCSAAVPNLASDRVNKFVGVSQVFSSLDEYRKNIESLEAGIQLYKKNGTDESEMYEDIQENNQNAAKCVNRSEEVEEDPYADDEINKFVSTDEEHGFSSNSITTSSSSTFSSGPSPALLSTESESSFDARLMDRSVLLLQRSDDNIKQLDNKLRPQLRNTNDCDKELPRSEFDDLAVGLSSISLTNQGSTLSLDITSSKCILKTENLSSSLSLSQATKNFLNSEELLEQSKDSAEKNNSQEKNESSLKLASIQSDRVDQVSTIAQPTSHQNVMVTFGSTMDEISDTELDSILQEIDAEMPLQTCLETVNVDRDRITTSEQTKKKVKIDRRVNSALQQDNTKKNDFSPNLSCTQKFNNAMNNVDSFSQASTIELVEDIIHEDNIDNCKSMDDIFDGDIEEQKNSTQSFAQKRQRPTTLDLPIRKINLYATAGQTPPGSRIYDQTTSSSEEDTPEDKSGLLPSGKKTNFSDAAGHTPPERSDRSIVGHSAAEIEIRNCPTNYDEPMTAFENTEIENQVSTQALNSDMNPNLGKVPPIWVPDHEANSCMQCQHKFTLLKRRHHCRACGQVLCSVCCSQKFKLEFLSNPESRVCVQCFLILTKLQQQMEQETSTATVTSPPLVRTPNPNNPMEYCSTIPPHRQVNPQTMSYPTVIVPVGVLKKEGNIKKSRKRKSVMFSDGIRPGSDLASLDGKWSDAKHARKSLSTNHFTTENAGSTPNTGSNKNITRNNTKTMVLLDENDSFIPKGENSLPPIFISTKADKEYQEVPNNSDLIKRLHNESLKFVVQTNFYVFVKISHLKCCINKTVINFTTCGLHHVGNDEIIILLELDNSNQIPKDIFVHLNEIYWEASKGHPITELGFSMPKDLLFLGSREHGGFLFIRSSFQCLQDVHVPNSPFLIGVLIHRWEVPWAKIFPLRLMLRLGAQYRYYPSPHISVRDREPVYADIAQTIINLLADFRNYSYTLPTIKGMYIHMEDRRTNILIPRNRHDEVVKAIKDSSDHILAMAANFSKKADGHLVCIQNIKTESTDSHSYSTQAINIQGQPRKVTGASFFVLNEALKSTSGLSGKCSIIEDGLMVQIMPTKMIEIKNALLNMKDIEIVCGPIEAGEQQTELVYIEWVDDDVEINIGVRSPIDLKEMDGIPSIRVHSGVNLSNNNHILKWTEVFVIEISDDNTNPQCKPAVDISKVSEQIAKNASVALFPFLDLLAANSNIKIGLRVTLNTDNVCYEAGSQSEKLPPLYMNALDNELIPTLHKQANEIGKNLVLELIFHILNV